MMDILIKNIKELIESVDKEYQDAIIYSLCAVCCFDITFPRINVINEWYENIKGMVYEDILICNKYINEDDSLLNLYKKTNVSNVIELIESQINMDNINSLDEYVKYRKDKLVKSIDEYISDSFPNLCDEKVKMIKYLMTKSDRNEHDDNEFMKIMEEIKSMYK